MILLFVQLNFTQVVDKTECTNYSHIQCIVYLVIGRSSQDSYLFTSFATAVGHANFRALSFIHIMNGRDTIGYSFSTGMNDITTLVDFADDGAPIDVLK